MNSLFYATLAFIVGLTWMSSAPIKMQLAEWEYNILPEDNILLAILFVLFVIVIKKIRFIIGYTDESMPLYLSLLGLALALGGTFVFTRLMLLGVICLVLAAYWSRGTVFAYYR